MGVAVLMFVAVLIGLNQMLGPWVDLGGLVPDAAPTQAAPPPAEAPAPPGAGAPAPQQPPAGTRPCRLRPERQQACRDAKAYAFGRVLARWGAAEWPCLDELWVNESQWDPWAVNPSSDAYGIAQILPAAHGHPPNTELGNFSGQIEWGLDYIANRPDYGSPCPALRLWKSRSPHWY